MQKIIEAVDHVLDFLGGVPLSTRTIKAYKNSYKRIIVYCDRLGINTFTSKETEQFIKNRLLRMQNGEISSQYFRLDRRAATLLAEQIQGKKLSREVRRYNQRELRGQFEKVFTDFTLHLSQSLAPGTIRLTVGVVQQFLFFLEDIEVHDISQVSQENVNAFLFAVAPKHKSSMSAVTLSIKKLLTFLGDTGITKNNTEIYIINPAASRRKLLPCLTDGEINGILTVVNTSSPMGKRDYAIIKLALGTGLRSVDIFSLRLQDIDWQKNEINVLQSKTNVLIQIPLQPDVGNSIADYILHGRPQSDSPYIFLRSFKPHIKLSSSQAGRNIIAGYLKKAGIPHEAWDGKRFHALRRTMGTRLVRAGLPIESVSEMLGQKSVESAKRYISLNDSDLRICCLDIAEYTTGKDGLL